MMIGVDDEWTTKCGQRSGRRRTVQPLLGAVGGLGAPSRSSLSLSPPAAVLFPLHALPAFTLVSTSVERSRRYPTSTFVSSTVEHPTDFPLLTVPLAHPSSSLACNPHAGEEAHPRRSYQ